MEASRMGQAVALGPLLSHVTRTLGIARPAMICMKRFCSVDSRGASR